MKLLYKEGRLSSEFQFKTKEPDQVGYLDKHEILGWIPVDLPDSPVLYSYLMYVHTKSNVHASLETKVCKIHKKMRVVKGLRRLIKRGIADCVKCRLMEKKTLKLRLANHPKARTVLTPCFHSCMMDICYGFKGQPFKRSRKVFKIYGLVIVCLLSEAMNIMALEGIETQDVCAALERIDMESLVLSTLIMELSSRHYSMQNSRYKIWMQWFMMI